MANPDVPSGQQGLESILAGRKLSEPMHRLVARGVALNHESHQGVLEDGSVVIVLNTPQPNIFKPRKGDNNKEVCVSEGGPQNFGRSVATVGCEELMGALRFAHAAGFSAVASLKRWYDPDPEGAPPWGVDNIEYNVKCPEERESRTQDEEATELNLDRRTLTSEPIGVNLADKIAFAKAQMRIDSHGNQTGDGGVVIIPDPFGPSAYRSTPYEVLLCEGEPLDLGAPVVALKKEDLLGAFKFAHGAGLAVVAVPVLRPIGREGAFFGEYTDAYNIHVVKMAETRIKDGHALREKLSQVTRVKIQDALRNPELTRTPHGFDRVIISKIHRHDGWVDVTAGVQGIPLSTELMNRNGINPDDLEPGKVIFVQTEPPHFRGGSCCIVNAVLPG